MFIRKPLSRRANDTARAAVNVNSATAASSKPAGFMRRRLGKPQTKGSAAKFTAAPRGPLPPVNQPRPAAAARSRRIKDGGDSLKIYCLGGQEEVGRNCTVFEYGSDIIILDMGIQFPDEDMPGIDYIIPNVSSLENKKRNIRGVIFSHGHLDHIGAAPMLLEKLGNPLIIGRQLTLALIKNRQEDYKRGTANKLKTATIQSLEQKITLGKFKVAFFPVDHSIMDAVGVIIQTPQATIIHPGDWALEQNPVTGKAVTYEQLGKLPSPRVLMLESLGATVTKERVSTKVTMANIQKLIEEAPGRIIIGTFSSQIERIKYILEYAENIGKKVALDGYSMKMNIEIAKELGYIKAHKSTIIGIEQIHRYPDNQIIVICTGAQGENNASFARIVNNNHRHLKIQPNDTVVFSSSVIPGNEATIQKLKDQIYRLTENVFHTEIMDVHSSGHATAADIKAVLKQIKPDYFLPVYANYYMLVEAKKLAIREGFKADKVFVLENGDSLEFKRNSNAVLRKEAANTDYVMVDGLGIGDISEIVLRDRQVMSEDGMIVVIATIYSKTGNLVGNPDIISRGFIHMKENKKLVEDTRMKAKEIVMSSSNATKADENFIKNKLRNTLGEFLFRKTQRRPMVLPVIIKV
ncbi:hypothetical protein A3G56_02690 [Candidatus Falkowbacteria bacterium RIFCSPLOWO2_12_FULL_45_10]|uniref:Metallo-beta-lactamase domain-containing protein n=3 Tax=Candidatus Falkowiibacteriota TaxID=1752728 RepID=A0A1F5RVV6_9BACT|nr:MAG: hypothetical protein A3D54_04050 [Candidatus Falkowbacteria bacterium RIFCSPHIGHO2_02_FULL_45_15]OGF18816.1 MAG: hypothetical protein A3I35_03635 [Candidatus Falkowbacteria bacterium RIFCSPLOWO2_02_FULL_45_15]OGF19231.1 MAG: hypothetical protein A3G56_02690 [Candidatus Falkowbacteria bacterium RIFCSPLOWO2_12_FULL_45_10]